MKTDLFPSCGHCWVFQICWHIECSTFTASSFRIWNSSTGIPSPPLALFIWYCLRPTLLHIPGCLALGEGSHHLDYLGHEDHNLPAIWVHRRTAEQSSSLSLCRACHSFTQAHCRASNIQQKMCLLGEQRNRAPSILTLSQRIPDEPPRWKVLLNHKRRWDSWPPEEKNLIRGQKRGLITQSFYVIEFY